MKKFIKILFTFFCLSLLGVAGLITYALNSVTFQTNQANKYLPTFVAGASIDTLDIGLGSLVITNLHLPLDSADVKITSLKIKYNLKALLFNEIIIYDLNTDSIYVNLIEQAPQIVDEKAPLIVAENETPIQRSTSSTLPNPAPKAEEKESSNFLQKYSLRIDNANVNIFLQNKDLKNQINISVKKYLSKSILLPTQGELLCNLKSNQTTSSIDFIANLQPKDEQNILESILKSNDTKLLQCSANFDKNFSKFDAKVRLDISNNDIKDFVSNATNAPFKGSFFADIKADTSIENVECVASFTFNSGDLTALNQSLAGLENLNAQGDLLFNKKANIVNIDSFKIDILQNAYLLLNALIKEKISIDLENPFAIPDGELLIVNIEKIPEGILKRYLPDFKISPNKFSTSISLSKVEKQNAFSFKSVKPLEFNSMNISKGDSLLIQNLNSRFYFDILFESTAKITADLKFDLLENNDATLSLNSRILLDEKNISSNISLVGNLKPILDLQPQSIAYSKYFNGKKIDLDSKLFIKDNIINLSYFDTKIFDENYNALLSALTTGEMSYDFANNILDTKNNQAKILAKDTPFGIVSSFLPNANGESFSCDLTLNKKDLNLIINGFASIKNLTYTHEGELLAKNITPYINFDALLEKSSLELKIFEFTLSQNNIQVIKGNAEANCAFGDSFVLRHAKIAFASSLPALMNLEVLNKYNNISTGYAECLITANEKTYEASGKISNFSTRTLSEKVEVFNFEVKAEKNDILYDIFSNIEIYSARGKSHAKGDFLLGDSFDINLNAENLILDDITVLSKAFSKPTVNTQKTIAPASAANSGVNRNIQTSENNFQVAVETTPQDAKAFWNFGHDLDFVCNIKSIQNKGDFLLKNFSGKLKAQKDFLSMEYIKGVLYEGTLDMAGKCTFDANAKIPYILDSAKFTIDKINLEPLTKNQNGESMIYGLFDANAKIKSQGENLDALLYNITGEAEFKNANNGVLALINQTSLTGTAIGTASTALGIGEKLLGAKVKEVGAANELFRIFQALEYTSLTAKATRKENLDINIEKIEMKSQDIIILGNGMIAHSKNLPINQQDISINAEILVSEKTIAPLFKTSGLLRDGSLLEGFATGPKFIVNGSLSSPTNNLPQILRTAGTNSVNSLLQKLQKN